MLLTAPPLWMSGVEISISTLLGAEGFRYLLALDSNPQPLQKFLILQHPFQYRLGRYAEALLAFWFSHAPHAKLIAQNVAVIENNQTLGALDFIVALNNQIYHIELTCKYYGSHTNQPHVFSGFDHADTLDNKSQKLTRQLALSQTQAGQRILNSLDISPKAIQTASIVRGMVFTTQYTNLPNLLNPYCWQGSLWNGDFQLPEEARIALLSPLQKLAPARLLHNETLPPSALADLPYGLIAVLEQRPDGYWHENHRLMKPKAV